jgi:hypothetical protein
MFTWNFEKNYLSLYRSTLWTHGLEGSFMSDTADLSKMEQKYRDIKKTKIGLAFLLGGASASLLALATVMISCLAGLLTLTGFALMIVGYIFMIRGRKALKGSHQRLVFVALVYFIIAIILSLTMGLFISGPPDLDLAQRMTKGEITGTDIQDTMEREQESLLPSAITGSMTAVAWGLIVFMPSKKWGRILIGAFIVLSMILITTSLMMQTHIYQESINSIQYDEMYSLTDYQDIRIDLLKDQLPAYIVGAIPQILLIIVLVGAFLNIRNMEEKNKPSMDNRLDDLKLS